MAVRQGEPNWGAASGGAELGSRVRGSRIGEPRQGELKLGSQFGTSFPDLAGGLVGYKIAAGVSPTSLPQTVAAFHVSVVMLSLVLLDAHSERSEYGEYGEYGEYDEYGEYSTYSKCSKCSKCSKYGMMLDVAPMPSRSRSHPYSCPAPLSRESAAISMPPPPATPSTARHLLHLQSFWEH